MAVFFNIKYLKACCYAWIQLYSENGFVAEWLGVGMCVSECMRVRACVHVRARMRVCMCISLWGAMWLRR